MEYVSYGALSVAKAIEKRLAELSSESGVLFVSAAPDPAPNGESKRITVRLGMDRTFSPTTGQALIRHMCAAEIKDGYAIVGEVYLGIARTCRNDSPKTASPNPT